MDLTPSPTAAARTPWLMAAGLSSLGAGAIHAAAIGIHAEHAGLARIFVIVAAAQLGAGLWAVMRGGRLPAAAVAVTNVAAVAGWLATRLTGISWISGLETREAAQYADTTCAALGALAAVAAVTAIATGAHAPARESRSRDISLPALVVLALTVSAMWTGGTHVHAHDHDEAAAADGHAHDEGETGDQNGGATSEDGHDHSSDGTTATDDTVAHDHSGEWPRAWDPSQPIDFSGVAGVSAEQQARAEELVADTLDVLPQWATTEAAINDGFRSIGDAGTGSEHYIRYDYINDDHFLDPNFPESLVYTVNGDERTLAGVMFIASARPTDDPTLTDFAGPLMTWHNHGNLCWDTQDGVPKVVGTTDSTGKCAQGINTGGENPMVHVWIIPHPCGPFAALDGVGQGQTAVDDAARTDVCAHHDHGDGASAAEPTTHPYDPTQPIDLGGVPGVTPEQQAAAENLVAVTVVRLPQWADYRVAEAAGFHSIGDAGTGVEHYINWDWIEDDVWLDPDHPESLVYQPQPDGSKLLVSAMYMLPTTVGLDEVPDIGGALMQWHIHDNLCFSDDPVAPQVRGLTSADGSCPPPLVKLAPSAMIHVWIVPHACGPFAALEGIGAGQILDGEERLCDHAHGSDTATF